jgi:uncharacterized membrane protein
MYSELIVMVRSGKEDIDEARHFIEVNHGGELFGLIDMVLIDRDTTGKITYQMRWKEGDYPFNSHGRLASTFAEVIFDNSRAEERRQLVEAGLDPFFLRKVSEAFKPDSLAYLIHIPRESLLDSRRFLEILEAQQGDLYHTTFRSQVEEVLLRQTG